jgi:type I restriction enzyme, S subunit
MSKSKYQEQQLGELIHIKHGYLFKSEYFSNLGKYILLTPGNFFEVGGFRERPGKDRFYIGEFPSNYILKKGDLIVAMTEQGEGLLGSTALIPSENQYLHNQRLGLIRIKDSSKLDKRYLFYLFNISLVRQQIRGSSSGTKVRHTSPERIYKVQVEIPPLFIQEKISAIACAYDDLIENNDRRITLLEKMAEEIYREWFVRLRFPGHEQATFHKGIPEGWLIQPLQKIAQINMRSLTKGKEPKEINYVDIGSVTTNQINNIERINLIDAPGRARRIVKHGDTIWATVRPANRAYCLILDPIENLIVSTGFAVISPKKNIPYSFLHLATTSNVFVEHISNVAKGSAYPAAGKEDFENSEILIPPQELLSNFHSSCEPMLKHKQILAERNKILKQTRDRLLTRLISGKLSVEDLDIQFPPSMTTDF